MNRKHTLEATLRINGRRKAQEIRSDGQDGEISPAAKPGSHQNENLATSWIWRDDPGFTGRQARAGNLAERRAADGLAAWYGWCPSASPGWRHRARHVPGTRR